MAKTVQAAAYLRRSTKAQESSIDDQRRAVREFAQKAGYSIVQEYVDDGISGDDTENRCDFQRMRDDAQTRRFNVVVCWDQERFGRFDLIEAGYWIKPFRDAGVRLVTCDQGEIDWTSFTGRLTYAIQQEGKHSYLHDLSRNVLRGQMAMARAGSWCGSFPFGYVLESVRVDGLPKPKKVLVLGESAKQRVVQRIFREFVDDRCSMNQIAVRLNAEGIRSPKGQNWHSDSIKSILSNVAYEGTFCFNKVSRSKYHRFEGGEITAGAKNGPNPASDWIVIKNHHQAIVDKGTFATAQRLLANGKGCRNQYSVNANPYLFTGLLRCGICGNVMHGIDNRIHRYYECSRVKRFKDCPGTTVREDRLIEFVALYIDTEILEGGVEMMLWEKAAKGTLQPRDLPKPFQTLKRMFAGPEIPKSDTKRIKNELRRLDNGLAVARGNLALVKPENIKSVEDTIELMSKQRDTMLLELQSAPTQQDINQMVLRVLRKLYMLATLDPQRLRPALREIRQIVVHSDKTGKGPRTRHELKRVEVQIPGVRTVSSNLNRHNSGKNRVCCR